MISLLAATILFFPEPVVSIPGWSANWEAAKAQSLQTGKPILANFTGSDWCPYCIRLEEEVFTTEEFKSWAKEKVILLEVDFPQGKKLPEKITKQNEQLAREYGVSAFPSILFLDGNGDVLGNSGYLRDPGPKVWTQHADQQITLGKIDLKSSNGWPKIVAKQLSAENDVRGKKLQTTDFGKIVNGKAAPKKGRVLIVDLWATWCGPCVQEMPKLEAWAKKYSNYVDIIGVSEEDAATIKEFAAKRPVSYPLYSDTDAKIYKELMVGGIPFVLVISPDGIVRYEGSPNDPSDPLTERVLQKIITASKLRK
ncbi:MAG: redoxin domain-containing protein [Fimbriimonadaceae bacterium]|nr:MAG: redoxin domain-containing protein [Fimbriimonadaceae bacterium]